MDVTPIRGPSPWEKRTKMEKRLIIALMLSVTISMALMFALIFARPIIVIAQNNKYATQEDSCLTTGCIKAAGQILERLDPDVDPCDNFYNFACGNYIKSNTILPGKPIKYTLLGVSEKIQKQLHKAIEESVQSYERGTTALIKKYYQACMNTTFIEKNSMETLAHLLTQLGGWPLLNNETSDEDDFDWKKLMYRSRDMGIDSNMLVSVTVEPDSGNSSRYIITLKEPQFGLAQDYLVKGSEENSVKAYYDYMVDIAILLGANKDKAMEDLKQSLEFEMRLANFSLQEREAPEVDEVHNVITIGELQQKYPSVPWLDYLSKILSTDVELNKNEPILVATPSYLSYFTDLIEETPKRIQANYAIWRSIQTLVPFLPERFRLLKLKFQHAVTGESENTPQWQHCINEATHRLPILAGALYIRNYFNEDSKESALEIVKYIGETFDQILKTVDWMDVESQRNAVDKAKAIKEHIGYPDELLNVQKIKEIHQKAKVNPEQYLQSYLNLNRFATNFSYNNLHNTPNNSHWVHCANPAKPIASYNRASNNIVFSAATLQGLLFAKERPHYMNFGALGSAVGHELTHGFDETGRNLNKNGLPADWWAPKAKQLFLKKSQCIIHQYGNYTVTELGQNLNGENTKNENIADNGGVKQAYLAYKAWVKSNNPELKLPGLDYSPNQLFWISYAMQWCAVYKTEMLRHVVASDSHSPNEFRVLGPLSNSEYFSNDFSCQRGAKMNPVRKCSIW